VQGQLKLTLLWEHRQEKVLEQAEDVVGGMGGFDVVVKADEFRAFG